MAEYCPWEVDHALTNSNYTNSPPTDLEYEDASDFKPKKNLSGKFEQLF